jgi:putative selenate reductase
MMSDRFHTLPLGRLLSWFQEGRKSGQFYGLPASLVFHPSNDDLFRMHRYGRLLESPLGVAAGPHTQLAQNIVSAWLMGARFMELKTVQTLDEIEVAKPCIDMEREGYNCEWSQELTLQQSAEEYLKAWVLIHAIRRLLGSDGAELGTIFNLSVGYDLKGIQNKNVQAFLDAMTDSSTRIEELVDEASAVAPELSGLKVAALVSDNVTVSTMHGCPPGEIESIGKYLMAERKLHTAIKLNPTLLGPDRLRRLLDTHGFSHLSVPDQAFEHDLKWDEALELIESLRETSKAAGVEFGLKLTNTLEVNNIRKVLPEDQKQLYLSGRALHPLAVTLADTLQEQFGGALDLSFCAGADAFNTPTLVEAGLAPVTVCTDLLRPGGYTRLAQYIDTLRTNNTSASPSTDRRSQNLRGYADLLSDGAASPPRLRLPMKTARDLPRYDCALAPCVQACAIEQDIPDYLWWTEQGDEAAAWDAVLRQNPLPRITGMVCDHLCVTRCTRTHYEDPILIREVKRFIAERAKEAGLEDQPPKPAESNGLTVAVIGAGPSGLSAAWFLAMEGCDVHVYDQADRAGGMASGAIPEFRLNDEALDADIHRIEAAGVALHLGEAIDRTRIQQLHKQNDALFLAVGAQGAKKLGLPGEDSAGVFDQLRFLDRVRKGERISLGTNVAIIGGGNSAVDAARTARRLVDEGGSVTVLYRRRRAEMPADHEEVEALDTEGIALEEQVAPVKLLVEDGHLTGVLCQRMEMGEPDESGRARPVPIEGSEFELKIDSLITALGQNVLLDLPFDDELVTDPETMETPWAGVYAGGDAIRGASTLIRAVRDGRRAADHILARAGVESRVERSLKNKALTLEEVQRRQAKKVPGVPIPHSGSGPDFSLVHPTLTEGQARSEGARCLQCSDICNICVAVCPNRANIALPAVSTTRPVYEVQPGGGFRQAGTLELTQPYQIVNLPDLCNECGNCVTFCPSGGRPWKDKPRVTLSRSSFAEERDAVLLQSSGLTAHGESGDVIFAVNGGTAAYHDGPVQATFTWPALELIEASNDGDDAADLSRAADLGLLYSLLREHYISVGATEERA